MHDTSSWQFLLGSEPTDLILLATPGDVLVH